MQLKITTTENIAVYEGEIKNISLPTQQGQQEFGANQMPSMVRLIPGLITITSAADSKTTISIAKGIALINSSSIKITASTVTTTPLKKLTELRTSQYVIELKLQKLKQQGSIEDINKLILELEKVKADIQLAQLA